MIKNKNKMNYKKETDSFFQQLPEFNENDSLTTPHC